MQIERIQADDPAALMALMNAPSMTPWRPMGDVFYENGVYVWHKYRTIPSVRQNALLANYVVPTTLDRQIAVARAAADLLAGDADLLFERTEMAIGELQLDRFVPEAHTYFESVTSSDDPMLNALKAPFMFLAVYLKLPQEPRDPVLQKEMGQLVQRFRAKYSTPSTQMEKLMTGLAERIIELVPPPSA